MISKTLVRVKSGLTSRAWQMKYRDLAEDILDYVNSQEIEGSHISEAESLSSIEEIIEDFMRKEEYFAAE
jgi:hypothetical protein